MKLTVAEINTHTQQLIDAWCERRCYRALRAVLPCWPHFGHSDQVVTLRNALRHARASAKSEMTEHELQLLGQIIAVIDQNYGDVIDLMERTPSD